nr:hypothetical protein Iba_chr13cCG2000 [Ipomoea batatas]GMD80493.1 hypothetical protein Iba_chr13eCG2410 [Ipomoea batatas]
MESGYFALSLLVFILNASFWIPAPASAATFTVQIESIVRNELLAACDLDGRRLPRQSIRSLKKGNFTVNLRHDEDYRTLTCNLLAGDKHGRLSNITKLPCFRLSSRDRNSHVMISSSSSSLRCTVKLPAFPFLISCLGRLRPFNKLQPANNVSSPSIRFWIWTVKVVVEETEIEAALRMKKTSRETIAK